MKFVFTLVGGHISPVLVAAQQRGIRVVDTRHEVRTENLLDGYVPLKWTLHLQVTTVFAADAVARLSQGIGVACVTAGPGKLSLSWQKSWVTVFFVFRSDQYSNGNEERADG